MTSEGARGRLIASVLVCGLTLAIGTSVVATTPPVDPTTTSTTTTTTTVPSTTVPTPTSTSGPAPTTTVVAPTTTAAPTTTTPAPTTTVAAGGTGSEAITPNLTASGWTTTAAAPSAVAQGNVIRFPVSVRTTTSQRALVNVDIYIGSRRVRQVAWDNQSFTAGVTRTYDVGWTVPTNATLGLYYVRISIYTPGRGALRHSNPTAESFRVVAPSWTLRATSPGGAAPGSVVRVPFAISSPVAATVTVTGEILYGGTVRRTVSWTGQSFTRGVEKRYSIGWTVPVDAPLGTYTVRLIVRNAAGTTLGLRSPATSFTLANRSNTLPPGSALPSDATCAARVRPAAEVRSANATANQTVGTQRMSGAYLNRVTGNFRGTTDEIIQWASCKWGFDEDIIRAQAALESWWTQGAEGDWGTDPTRCPPGHGLGADGRPGECPETYGIIQDRYPYMMEAFPSAINSTAFNIDTGLAFRRRCFEGADTWLNQVERGRQYVAGDLWGCVGTWFAGRWYTPEATNYISRVQGYLADRVWESPGFRS